MSIKSVYTELNPSSTHSPVLSIIVPFYNEQDVLPAFSARLSHVLQQLTIPCEVIYVDDGSTDESVNLVKSFRCDKHLIRCIALSRNFGKEAAMSAGLDHCQGQAAIIIDADLQDPPEQIPRMLDAWQQGADVVNMQRSVRHGETWFKRFSAKCFYRLLNTVAQLHVPENVGDFRLLSRKVIDHIKQLPERNRYMKGIFSWPGFTQVTLSFERDGRFCGETKWNYIKLIGLAVDGITSFSIRPLRLATLAGALVALGAMAYGAFIVVKTLIFGEPVQGYPSMMVAMLALGSIQLFSIGVLGEYIGRIFIETKQRPLYLVKAEHQYHAVSQSTKLGDTA